METQGKHRASLITKKVQVCGGNLQELKLDNYTRSVTTK